MSRLARWAIAAMTAAALAAVPVQAEPPAQPGQPVQDKPAENLKFGYLGIVPAPAPVALLDQLKLEDGRGVLVAAVQPDSPAAKAGLAEHDLIVGIDRQIIYSIEQLTRLVNHYKPGTAVAVELFRKGKAMTVKATVGGTAEQAWRRMPMMAMPMLPGVAPFELRVRPGPDGGDWLAPWNEGVRRHLEKFKDKIPPEIYEDLMRSFAPPAPAEQPKDEPKAQPPAQPGQPGQPAEAKPVPPRQGAVVARGGQIQIRLGGVAVAGGGPNGVAVQTISSSSPNYRATRETRTDLPALYSLFDKDGKGLFEKVAEADLDNLLPTLDEEARKLLESLRKMGGGMQMQVQVQGR